MAASALSLIIQRLAGKRFGVMLPASAGGAVAVLACLFAGRAPVWLNFSTGIAWSVRLAKAKCAVSHVITSKQLLDAPDAATLPETIFIEDMITKIGIAEKGDLSCEPAFKDGITLAL